MENRFQSGGIIESDLFQIHSYPVRWDLTKHNRGYAKRRFIENIQIWTEFVVSPYPQAKLTCMNPASHIPRQYARLGDVVLNGWRVGQKLTII